MGNVDSIFVLGNPLRTDRLLYVLQPLIPGWDAIPQNYGVKLQGLEAILYGKAVSALRGGSDSQSYSGLRRYQENNELMARLMSQLAGRTTLLLPGVFGTGPGSPAIGYDFFAVANLLAGKLSEVAGMPGLDKLMAKVVALAQQPVLIPIFVSNGKAEHSFPAQFQQLNQEIEESGRIPMGTWVTEFDKPYAVGTSQISKLLYTQAGLDEFLANLDNGFDIVKAAEQRDKVLASQRLNNTLQGIALAGIVAKIGGRIISYAPLSTNWTGNAELISNLSGVAVHHVNPYRASKGIERERLLSYTAINMLAGALWALVGEQDAADLKPVSPRKKIRQYPDPVGRCYATSAIICPKASICDSIQEPKMCLLEALAANGDRDLMVKSLARRGVAAGAIEQIALQLQTGEIPDVKPSKADASYKGKAVPVYSWRQLWDGGAIEPLQIPPPEPWQAHLNASAVGKGLGLEQVVSQLADRLFPLDITMDPRALVGILVHELFFGHWITQYEDIWETWLGKSVARKDYTEQPVLIQVKHEDEIIRIAGRIDALLQLNKDGKRIMIPVELKSMMNSKSYAPYLIQNTLYALGVEQATGISLEEAYLAFVNPPFRPHKEGYEHTRPLGHKTSLVAVTPGLRQFALDAAVKAYERRNRTLSELLVSPSGPGQALLDYQAYCSQVNEFSPEKYDFLVYAALTQGYQTMGQLVADIKQERLAHAQVDKMEMARFLMEKLAGWNLQNSPGYARLLKASL